MTAQRFVHDILQLHALPLMQRLPGAIFQQDNARPHTARVSQDCLRTVTTLPWPARSPYLSLIEYIRDHLGRLVAHSTSLNELEASLQQIWNEMPQDIIQNLYAREGGQQGCPRILGTNFKVGEVGDIQRIPNCTATHGRKCLRLALGSVAQKSIGRNRPQSFDLSSFTEKYGTFYKHRAGRYVPESQNGRRKRTSSRKIVSLKGSLREKQRTT
ncbi:transposable element Tcb1 transposase [Trichonephila clavipes]|nr:transposable element Tcb1 transposase [Trichonephila clavipes]